MKKTGKKILFVGNSITWHPVKEEIGWFNEWGMAASSEENDFVHLVMKDIRKTDPIAKFKISWAVAWEREYWDAVHLVAFREFLNFKPDIIIVKINENVTAANNEKYPYEFYYKKLLDYINPHQKSKIIVCTGFWKMGILDDIVRRIAGERGYPLVELNHLDEYDEMKAHGLFEHQGVAHHPGDKGMEAIAAALLKQLEDLI